MADTAPLLSNPLSVESKSANQRHNDSKGCGQFCNRPIIRYSFIALLGLIVSVGLFAVKSRLPWIDGSSGDSGSDSGSSSSVGASNPLAEYALSVDTMTESLLKGSLNKDGSITNFFVDTISRTLTFDSPDLGISMAVSNTDKGFAYTWTDGGSKSEGLAGHTLGDVNSYENWSKFINSDLSTNALKAGFKLVEQGHYGTHSNALRTFHMSLKIIYEQKERVMDQDDLTEMTSILNAAMDKQVSVTASELHKNRRMLQINMFRECTNNCTCEIVDADTLSNCTGSNDCLGRCGNGCNCWWWVCGDCDCNCFCREHDIWCSCTEYGGAHYRCWGMLLAFEACC